MLHIMLYLICIGFDTLFINSFYQKRFYIKKKQYL